MAKSKATEDLQQRMQASTGAASRGPSIDPWNIPVQPKSPSGHKAPKEDPPPDLRDVVDDPAARLKIIRLSALHAQYGAEEKEAKKQKENITSQIKELLNKYQVSRANADGVIINYYSVPRSSLDKGLLLSHGVTPAIIEASTVVKFTPTLRISLPGDSAEE